MRLNKLALAAIATALTLWSSNGKAVIVRGYQFEKLNFSLTAEQQGLENSETSSNVFVSTIKTSRISSKDLLSFLATAFHTNWPAGAQLALDNFSSDIFVVDKTGTNDVVNVSTGINVGDTNVVYFTFDFDTPVVGRKSASLEKSKEWFYFGTQIQVGRIFFHLFNEQNGVTNTDLIFDGLSVVKLYSTGETTTNRVTLHTATSEQASVAGDGTFNLKWTVVKGYVTSSGTRNGLLLPPTPGFPSPAEPQPPTFLLPTNVPAVPIQTNISVRPFPTNFPVVPLPITNYPVLPIQTNFPVLRLPTNFPVFPLRTNLPLQLIPTPVP